MKKYGINLITPFTESNEIDYEAVGRLIDNKLNEGIERIVLGGNCGEFESMNDEEIISLAKYSKEKIGSKAQVFLYTGFSDIRRTVLLTFKAYSVGVDSIVIKTPISNTNERGLLNYFKTVIQSSPIPVYIENRDNVEINTIISVCKELVKNKNFVGIIESSKEIERYILLRSILSSKELICGREMMIIPALSVGFGSIISTVGNIWSEEIKTIIDLYYEGDLKTSREAFFSLYPIFEMMEVEPNPIPIKTTMNMLGYNVGEFRPPLAPMNPDHASNIIRTLMDMNQIKN